MRRSDMKTRTTSLGILFVFLCGATQVANADFVFGEPENLGPAVNTMFGDSGACLSPDGLTLYLCDVPFDLSPDGHGGQDLWMATRAAAHAPWGQRVNMGPTLNTSFDDGTPSISGDGLTLYFSSTRPGGSGSWDLWMTTRPSTSDRWGAPTNLGATVNSLNGETFPSISADGLELYFSEWDVIRPDGYGEGDIWVTRRRTKEDPWGPPVNLGSIVNTEFREASPCIGPDGLTLFLWSQRPGGLGNSDMWITTRKTKEDPWEMPVNLGVPVNSPESDDLPNVTADGSMLYFSSSRAGGSGGYDLWQVPIIPIVDFNGDGASDYLDICDLVDHWGTYSPLYDIGPTPLGDGVVDEQDLIVLMEYVETGPVDYPIENVTATASSTWADSGPENTVNGSGLDEDDLHSTVSADMWLSAADGAQPVWIQYEFDKAYKLHEMLVWNYNVEFEHVLGYGLKNVTITHSEDGATWEELSDVEFAQATAQHGYACNTTVDLAGVKARFVRLTANTNWNGSLPLCGLSEVRFLRIPTYAKNPQPSDGQTNASTNLTLHWRAGREAISHEIHFSTDEEAVAASTALVGAVDETAYWPGLLDLGRTYYWKVNEVNEAEAASVWEGDVWSFSTEEYVIVEDFEGYTDNMDAESAIWQTWVDGWTNETGSTVGYAEAPFAERTVVHGGWQSMPLAYDNADAPFYSEAHRTFDTPGNWTGNGADTLRLYLRGTPADFFERDDGTIVMCGGGRDIWGSADEFRFAYRQITGDGSIATRVESLVHTDDWAKVGVMFRDTLEPGSRFAAVYITPGKGCRFQARPFNNADALSDSSVATAAQVAIQAPYWVKLERTGNNFYGFYSADGTTWTGMSWNPQRISMPDTIHIGLAVTSHSAGKLTTAEFSSLAMTGSVTGQWQVEAIGVDQPGNDPAGIYVALEDNAGHSKRIRHPDPEATLCDSWQEWLIPLSEFTSAGVDVGMVKKVYLGVGNPDAPASGGTGTIFVDDIGFGHPLCSE